MSNVPDLRETDNCRNCEYGAVLDDFSEFECTKHNILISPEQICDDYQ